MILGCTREAMRFAKLRFNACSSWSERFGIQFPPEC